MRGGATVVLAGGVEACSIQKFRDIDRNRSKHSVLNSLCGSEFGRKIGTTRSKTMRLAMAAMVAALLASGNAFAGDDPGAGKNKGKAGHGEMLMKLFEKADANGHGKLSLEEFKTALENAPKGKFKDNPEKIDKLFKRIDANG